MSESDTSVTGAELDQAKNSIIHIHRNHGGGGEFIHLYLTITSIKCPIVQDEEIGERREARVEVTDKL
jgi:hypothetical protein